MMTTKSNKWNTTEIEILRENWPKHRYESDIAHLLPGRTARAIQGKAYELKLHRNPEVVASITDSKIKSLIICNKKVIGRDRTDEWAKTESLKYTSKTEMYKKDNSLYQYLRSKNLWEKYCGHMIDGDAFNYPQTFLFMCIKQLHHSDDIRYNDRTAIHPFELDVYVQNLKIAFEYDGATYHSDNDKDLKKDALCKESGIKLYRIKEKNKRHPEKHIIEDLKNIGYNIDLLDIEFLVAETLKRKLTEDDILKIVSNYGKLTDFKRENESIYRIICKSGKLEKYCSHLTKPDPLITKQEIIDFFNSCKYKNETYLTPNGKRLYQAFKRRFKNDVDINFAYNNLIDHNILRNN